MKKELILKPDFIRRMAGLYLDMETAYDKTAAALDFSCKGCTDNCCDSYFLHYTHSEWAYLWHGLKSVTDSELQDITTKAEEYVVESEKALARNERPVIMCPLNKDGLCSLYPYRMMICRLHGVPAAFTRPDGRRVDFPGCFRCQEHLPAGSSVASLDRTDFFKRLAGLEMELISPQKTRLPKVKLTIAQMIIKGPPTF